ncbi:MAG: hypothetical protein L0Z62_41810 [Gemmataceae bacterium]|nr:hypothetical protein [Gemmataceae bacterium]
MGHQLPLVIALLGGLDTGLDEACAAKPLVPKVIPSGYRVVSIRLQGQGDPGVVPGNRVDLIFTRKSKPSTTIVFSRVWLVEPGCTLGAMPEVPATAFGAVLKVEENLRVRLLVENDHLFKLTVRLRGIGPNKGKR